MASVLNVIPKLDEARPVMVAEWLLQQVRAEAIHDAPAGAPPADLSVQVGRLLREAIKARLNWREAQTPRVIGRRLRLAALVPALGLAVGLARGQTYEQSPDNPFSATAVVNGQPVRAEIDRQSGDVVVYWKRDGFDYRSIVLRHHNAVVARLCELGAAAFPEGSAVWLLGGVELSEPHRAGVFRADGPGFSVALDSAGAERLSVRGRVDGAEVTGSVRVVGADVVASWSDGRRSWRLTFGPDLRPRLSYCACRDPAGGCTTENCDRGDACQTATAAVCEWMAAPPTGGGICGAGVAAGAMGAWVAGLAFAAFKARGRP